MKNVDLTCEFCNLSLKNPIILSAGIIGSSPTLLQRAAEAGAGAVTSKSCGLLPRSGHENPVALDWGEGVINAIGLTNPGAEEEVKVLEITKRLVGPLGVKLIASFFAGGIEEFGQVASIVARAQPDLLEVDISCPNVGEDFGLPFAASPRMAAEVTESIKREVKTIPLSVKLSPNVPNLAQIACAVAEAGADAITAINTMPGMIIDADSGRPVLKNKVGGISGRALKPIALKCVYDIARAVKLPVIGVGGVSTGIDAAEMLMAGATAVGVGTAVWYRGVNALGEIAAELETFMASHSYPNLRALRGKALH